MKFLHKLDVLNPLNLTTKSSFLISSEAINYLTWYKRDGKEGTCIHTGMGKIGEEVNHFVEALPEMMNQITFDGLFFKCTSHRVDARPDGTGGMKKYTAWINPENLSIIYQNMPDDCQVFFSSGERFLIVGKQDDILKGLLEHKKQLIERKKQKYGKK